MSAPSLAAAQIRFSSANCGVVSWWVVRQMEQIVARIGYGFTAGVAVALALVTAAPAEAMPNTQCTLTTPVHEVQHLSQVPPELVKLLPPIADIGAPFNATDSVSDPTLPFRRLIRAGNRDADWIKDCPHEKNEQDPRSRQ